jgi:hypothetical protein
MHDRTKGSVDLRTLAFLSLLGGGAYQIVRGHALPAGVSLVVQAFDVLFAVPRHAE